MSLPDKFVVTIGRSFGSGGRALGRLIAEKMGIGFYDNKLLVKAAEKAGLNLAYTTENDEKLPNHYGNVIPYSLGYYPPSWFGTPTASGPDNIYAAQCEAMRELARTEPCVIVGRTADYVLRDIVPTVNIFLHASDEACAARIMERCEAKSREEAIELVQRTNKLRSNFYNFYTDKQWGHALSYDLCLDSTVAPLEQLADFVIEYIKIKIGRN